MDTKKCSSCRCIKMLDNFETNQKVFKSCNSCRNYQKVNAEKIKQNIDKQRGCENSKKYYRIHKEDIKQRIALKSKGILPLKPSRVGGEPHFNCSQPSSSVSSLDSEIE